MHSLLTQNDIVEVENKLIELKAELAKLHQTLAAKQQTLDIANNITTLANNGIALSHSIFSSKPEDKIALQQKNLLNFQQMTNELIKLQQIKLASQQALDKQQRISL